MDLKAKIQQMIDELDELIPYVNWDSNNRIPAATRVLDELKQVIKYS